MNDRYVVVLDTPSIKQFVFGTDTLAEIRGASALLDRLNRVETKDILAEQLGSTNMQTVFANGGQAQFIVYGVGRDKLDQALAKLADYYSEQTDGEMRVLVGVADWPEGEDYRQAVAAAVLHLLLQRQWASGQRAVRTFPLIEECASSSYLPAAGRFRWAGESRILSRACQLKLQENRKARLGQLWHGWMEWLDKHPLENGQFLPPSTTYFRDNAQDLRPESIGDIAGKAKKNYVGLIYADGNAMGQLVQELDTPETYRYFSEMVDTSVRHACYEALRQALRSEIAEQQDTASSSSSQLYLPADILLLGGDDVVVLVPAERAFIFAQHLIKEFQQRTKEAISRAEPPSQKFFQQRGLAEHGLTLSCGIVIGPGNYPFYLLLELAGELLKNAKRGGSRDPRKTQYWAPSYLDFHIIAGSATPNLEIIREEDYYTKSSHVRTLRPYSQERFDLLEQAVRKLDSGKLPQSKLHDLFMASLERRAKRAQLYAEEIFGRLRPMERQALWQALEEFGELKPYPWMPGDDGKRATALADLIEALDWFGTGERINEERP
jgi:hypothetical protein